MLSAIPNKEASKVVYRERIATTDLESDHFSGQLVERVGWAVLDADAIERRDDGAIGGKGRALHR
jgi:hypothetical protein